MALGPESLRTYLHDRMGLNLADLQDETPLFSSNLLDSFSMVDLIMFIEAEAGIRVQPANVTLDNFDSIARILSFVASCDASQESS